MKGLAVILMFIGAVKASENGCPPEQETDWTIEMLLEHEDCTKFYKCTYGQPVEQNCYPGLYFNIETWQCDWKHNVDCGDRYDPSTSSTTTTTTTTPAPTTTTSTTTTTTPAPTTTTSTTTTTTPAPTTTTSTTTTTTPAPTTTTSTTTTPAPTTTTSTSTTTTPAPTTTTTTTTSTTTTPAPTTTTTTTTTPPPTTTEADEEMALLPNGCPVDPHIHWLLPHETECNLFYYCVWGQKVLRECPGILHFNRVLQVCDWPVDAGCTIALNKHRYLRKTSLESEVEVGLRM